MRYAARDTHVYRAEDKHIVVILPDQEPPPVIEVNGVTHTRDIEATVALQRFLLHGEFLPEESSPPST